MTVLIDAVSEMHGTREAKPCPFCGDTEVGIVTHSGWVYAECYECGAMSGGVRKSRIRDRERAQREAEDEAIYSWNARVGEPLEER